MIYIEEDQVVVERRSLTVILVNGFRFARSVHLPLSVYHPCVAYTWNPTVSRDQQVDVILLAAKQVDSKDFTGH